MDTLLKKINKVIENGDTPKNILDKIKNEYSEYFEKRSRNYDNILKTEQQLKAEISSTIYRYEDIIFNIDRNVKPHTFSIITTDEIETFKNDEEIETFKNDEEIEKDSNTGYIYILNTNLYDENGKSIYKIGMSINVDKRVKQLNAQTASYKPHTIIKTYHVNRPFKIEHAIHNILDFGRVSVNKEGFYSDVVLENLNLIESMIKIFEIKE